MRLRDPNGSWNVGLDLFRRCSAVRVMTEPWNVRREVPLLSVEEEVAMVMKSERATNHFPCDQGTALNEI